MTPVTLRLVDGSELSDWHPGPGDAPCDVAGHTDHERAGCPDLFRETFYPCCGHCDPEDLLADPSLPVEVGCDEAPHTEPCTAALGYHCGGSDPAE